MEVDDLIAALASPPGRAAVGIVRICGRELRSVVDSGFTPDDPQVWRSTRQSQRMTGRWQLSAITVPCTLMYWPGSRSYTGQPTAEIYLPGSPPVLERVLAELYQAEVRPARPGEFTLRSFLAGKIDLVQAEAVLGVIDAHDEDELKTALDQLAGGISSRLMELRSDLLDVLSDLEAGLDFVEEDIEFISREEMIDRISRACDFVASLLTQSSERMTSDPVPKVVLAGLPNAGKSTLFNRLTGQSLALTSPVQGTTRDYLQTVMAQDGMTWELVDTAGWEVASSGISQAAQTLRTDQLRRAALIVWCSAANQTDEERQLDVAAFSLAASAAAILSIQTQCDLQTPELQWNSERLRVSAIANFGLEELRHQITAMLKTPRTKTSAWLGMTAARCRDSLEHASAALHRAAAAAANPQLGDELLAVDLREALDHLGTVVGAVYTDDLLDRIFSKFCIGK